MGGLAHSWCLSQCEGHRILLFGVCSSECSSVSSEARAGHGSGAVGRGNRPPPNARWGTEIGLRRIDPRQKSAALCATWRRWPTGVRGRACTCSRAIRVPCRALGRVRPTRPSKQSKNPAHLDQFSGQFPAPSLPARPSKPGACHWTELLRAQLHALPAIRVSCRLRSGCRSPAHATRRLASLPQIPTVRDRQLSDLACQSKLFWGVPS